MIEDVLRIVSGFGKDGVEDIISSDIDKVADAIDERILTSTRLRKA